MERISQKQKKMKDKLARELIMVETRLEREQAKDGELEKARLSFFPKIFSAIKEADRRNFILEQQKKMKDTLTRELTMVETRLEREQDKQEEWEKTRFEQEQVKNAELEKISITALQKVNIN